MSKQNEISLGIDFGTNFTCISYVNNKLPSSDINIPSIIYFNKDGKMFSGKQIPSFIYKIDQLKSLFCRSINDEFIKEYQKNHNFEIFGKENEEIKLKFKFQNKKEIVFTPSELINFFLKEQINKFCKNKNITVKRLILTIPIYYNSIQKQKYHEIGLEILQDLSNSNEIHLLYEPIAPIFRYIHDHQEDINDSKKILVFDHGRGTLDLSLIQINQQQNDKFKIKTIAIGGKSNIGGNKINLIFMNYLKKKYKIKNIDENKIEEIKKYFSEYEEEIELDFIPNSIITFEEYNEIIKEIIDESLNLCSNLLKENKIEEKEIDLLLLAGGSSNITLTQKKLKEKFKIQPVFSDPERTISFGASLFFFNSSKYNYSKIIPYSLGIQDNSKFKVHIPKFTKYPFDISIIEQNLGTSGLINTFEGESNDIINNYLIGSFQFNNEKLKIDDFYEINYKMDNNSILKIEVNKIYKQCQIKKEQLGFIEFKNTLSINNFYNYINSIPKKDLDFLKIRNNFSIKFIKILKDYKSLLIKNEIYEEFYNFIYFDLLNIKAYEVIKFLKCKKSFIISLLQKIDPNHYLIKKILKYIENS